MGTCQGETLARSRCAGGSPIVLGVRRAAGTPGFATKLLAPWSLLGGGACRPGWQERGNDRDAPVPGSPRLPGIPAAAEARSRLSPGREGGGGIRGALPGGAERGGSRPGREETPAGIARLRETLSRPAPAAWRGLEVKGGVSGTGGIAGAVTS